MAAKQYGVSIAQQVDATKAADNQLTFTNNFRLPLIVYTGQKVITADPSSPTTQNIFTHGLKYVPVFLTYARETATNLTGAINLSKINNYDLVIRREGGDPTIIVTYFIFNLPLLIDYDAPTLGRPAAPEVRNNREYGINISKEGKSVFSSNLSDLAYTSGESLAENIVRNHVLHKIKAATVARGSTVRIKHGLDYKPMTIFLIQESSSLRWLILDTGRFFDVFTGEFIEYLRAWVDKENIVIKHTTDGFSANESVIAVVFKNPLL